MPIKCKTCDHYKTPYYIYCCGCKHNPNLLDNYDPINPKSLRNAPHPRQEQEIWDEAYYNETGRV